MVPDISGQNSEYSTLQDHRPKCHCDLQGQSFAFPAAGVNTPPSCRRPGAPEMVDFSASRGPFTKETCARSRAANQFTE